VGSRKKVNWKKVSIFGVSLLLLAGGTFYVVAYHVLSGPRYKGPKSDHFDGNEFHNLEPTEMKGLGDVLSWQIGRDQGPWPDGIEPVESTVPPTSVNEPRVTFINHASLLIQINGLNILTDPIWSERASPFSFAGPARKREPGIQFGDLPPIHAVLISHNHYDHLDLSTLKMLRDSHDPVFIVPLGVDLLLQENGMVNTRPLDWFDQTDFPDIKIHAVPAKHFSGRGLGDTNQTLWAGYVIESNESRIYFAGDTGYGEFYGLVKEHFNPIDLALLPIGAYKPVWFMQPIHMSPAEAVQAHLDLGAKKSIGMHFGTFPMADDGQEEPIHDLQEARKNKNINVADFFTLDEGDHYTLSRE
jgi:L-ascorbate metabolism protein UlaG (beta-lactamase superfamily)